MSDLLKEWIAESPENERQFAEEGLILEVAEAIFQAMETKNMSKSDLAASLGKSKAYVSQLLSGSRNMTLRTLADIAFALGMKAAFKLREPLPYGHWESGSTFMNVQIPRRFLAESSTLDDVAPDWSPPMPLRAEAA